MTILRSFLHAVLGILGVIFNPIINFIFSTIYKDAISVTPIREPLLLQSATSLAKKIRSRETRAETVMKTFIERVKEVNPAVNAVIANRFEEALQEAKKVDDVLDQDNISDTFSLENAPFLGVPLSVKEAFATKGMPNTSGLVSRKNYVSDFDAPVVSNLRSAGFIPFVITNVSELCMWYESSNNIYGRTRNAYNHSRMVGGSSGGEGCIISSGASVCGIGSDIGGSIRMPAFFSGIFGHRSSRGVVKNDGQFPIPTGDDLLLLSTGPMCRYAEDLLPLLKIMAGNVPNLDLDQKVDLKKLRYFSMEDDGGSLLLSKVDPELKEAQRKAVKYLEEVIGVKVTPINISRMKYSIDIWGAKMSTSGGTSFCQMMANDKGSVNPFLELLKWLVRKSDHTLPAISLGILEKFTRSMESSNRKMVEMFVKLEEEMKELLGDDGILFYPSHPIIAPYHNLPLLVPFNFAYTAIFNTLGLPVTQCPLGLSKEGLPLGFQIVGPMLSDHHTIAVARELEKGLGGWVPPASGQI